MSWLVPVEPELPDVEPVAVEPLPVVVPEPEVVVVALAVEPLLPWPVEPPVVSAPVVPPAPPVPVVAVVELLPRAAGLVAAPHPIAKAAQHRAEKEAVRMDAPEQGERAL